MDDLKSYPTLIFRNSHLPNYIHVSTNFQEPMEVLKDLVAIGSAVRMQNYNHGCPEKHCVAAYCVGQVLRSTTSNVPVSLAHLF